MDVVFAQGTGNKTDNEANGLLLNFDHILSQIKIKAKHSSDTYTYQVKGIRIAYVGGSADYTFNPAKLMQRDILGLLLLQKCSI